MLTLSEFSQQATHAFNNTSFNPERLGKSVLSGAEHDLNSDVDQLRKMGVSNTTVERYVGRFKQHFAGYIGSEARCASSFICGPSNFPVERNRKRLNAARQRYDEFQAYRQRVVAAITRQANKERKAELGITPLIEARRNLNERVRAQAWMKQTNVVIRKNAKNTDDEKFAALMEMGHTPDVAAKLLAGDCGGRIGYPSYKLTNNNSQIVRLKERVEELVQKEYLAQKQAEAETIPELSFEGGHITLNYEDDRLRIHYDEKPSFDQIKELKRSGFKWSPNNKAWQRQLTGNAKYAARILTGVKFN